MIKYVKEATDFLLSRIASHLEIGVITGTGLGGLTDRMERGIQIPYEDIPHFPISTIEGHRGTLVSGTLAGRFVLAMEGRFHLYEGYSLQEVTIPIRIMSKLGIKYLFISSAAGGLNFHFNQGDLMIVTDHMNFTGSNPLIGPNIDEFGPRFPDMSKIYDSALIKLAKQQSLKLGIDLKQGVYAGVMGPSLETPAETRFLRMIGADAVGMSTVPEVIVGAHCGLRIAVIVVITNINMPDCMKETSIEEVISTANSASPVLADLWENIINALPE
ncbi:purine-nucleoside phosphorylase [bacterium]|nr:purine-nucleoside phosphorylase [bacterium]